MTFLLGTAVLLVVLNGGGLALSLWLDRRGLPMAWDGQAAKRKPGALKKRLPLIYGNLAMLFVLNAPVLVLVSDHFPMTVPKLGVAALQVAVLLVVDDTYFYWLHRALHRVPKLYQWIHKVHHKAYAPVPIEYIYVHPAEWLLGGVGPAIGVGLLLAVYGEMSAWTFWTWGAIRTLHELDIHSGVRAWTRGMVPLYADMTHHDLHHARPAKGNYASTFTFWDWVCRTEISRDP